MVNFKIQQECNATLGRLKQLGVRIALDDLGTAYASLLRLKDYPFNAVKLDQAFSRHLESRPRDLHFLASMLEMANGLGVELIVEGIESSQVFAAVTALGIRQVQGYAISRPVSASEISQRFLMMNLLYTADITTRPNLTLEFYYQVNHSKAGFWARQTRCVAMGDPYSEIVVERNIL